MFLLFINEKISIFVKTSQKRMGAYCYTTTNVRENY